MKRLLLIVALLSVGWSSDGSVPCEDVSSLRHAGEFHQAEDTANRCLEERSDDVEMMLELARAVYAQDRAEEATKWTDRALSAAPEHEDAIIFRARLAAQAGDYEAAIHGLDELSTETRESVEVQQLSANIALWSGDHEAAVAAYTAYLTDFEDDPEAWTNLGHAESQIGRLGDARESYRRSCEMGSERGCAALEAALLHDRTRYFARVRPGYSSVWDLPDGQTLQLGIGVEPNRQTSVEAGYHFVRRGFADGEHQQDMGVSLDASYTATNGLRTGAGAAWMFDVDFSPQWMAYVDGGWTTDVGLDAGLRLGRIQFPAGGINVISPSLTYYTGPWMFDGRYYLGVDSERSLSHATLGRVGYFFGDRTSVHVGGGVGNRPDYIELTSLTDPPLVAHYTGLAGGTFKLSDRHKFNLDLQYRHQSNTGFGSSTPQPTDTYRSFEVGLGYTVFNW